MNLSRRNFFGPSVVDGKLFFTLLDGSVVSCECIGEPHATDICETYGKFLSALKNARNILKDEGFVYADEIEKLLMEV